MLNPEAVPTIPAGPIETAPCGERPEEELETTLRDTLQAAGVQLGAYDGSNRAHVVDAHSGKKPRQILVNSLHATATTRDGNPRRSGYVLETS
ncbi:hypothetical protein [Streptomyces sp. NPDC088258]|uniref:hypothetical protein n=1 Tax=Streptomyces sp. NPDC088258 TaxID=3365849 RepID=UPI00380784E2